MSGKVVVFGATGAQGSGVVEALLARGEMAEVRGVTRNADSESAKKAAAKWADKPQWKGFISADADKPETLGPALAGADAVFLVTNFWEHFNGERELQQGKAVIDAAAAAGVKTLVFSGLDSPKKRVDVDHVLHFEFKYLIEDYLMTTAIPNKVSVRIAMYYENFLTMLAPRKGEDGSYTVVLPCGDAPVKLTSVAEYGRVVAAVLANPGPYNGQRVNVVADYLTLAEVAAIFSEVSGAKVTYVPVPTEVFAGFGFPGANDLAHMFKFYQLCPMEEADKVAQQLSVPLTPFRDWVAAHAAELKKGMGL